MNDPFLSYALWSVARMTDEDFRDAAERDGRTMQPLADLIHAAVVRLGKARSAWTRRRILISWEHAFDRLERYLATADG